MTFLRNFWKDEQGQDLIEYTLLMAFVALASAALFLGAGNSIKGIWSTTNSQLVAANSSRPARTPGRGMPVRWSSSGVLRSGLWPGEWEELRTAATRTTRSMGRRVAARVPTEKAAPPDLAEAIGVGWRD